MLVPGLALTAGAVVAMMVWAALEIRRVDRTIAEIDAREPAVDEEGAPEDSAGA